MAYRCPNSYVVCNGKLKGWRLVFNVHADIVKTDNENDFVPVVVWNIADADWNNLDMYEGYPSYYIKETVNVILDDGKVEKAIVYVMADNRKGIYPPMQSYFNCIYKGYTENGIDVEYLYEALEYSFNNKTFHNQYSPV
jgi:gamma-glutamylcyclotransferase (GGCT)/AIG2-like uncharacterized protein YtfP